MPVRPQTYHRPDTLAAAWQALQQPDTHPLAGGSKLLTGHLPLTVTGVVDLQQVGLNQLTLTEAGLRVGATVRLTDLADFLIGQPHPSAAQLLQNGVRRSGPNTYRNAATLGGTIASYLPDSELIAALLVLGAEIYLYGRETAVSLANYLLAPAQPAHLITHIIIPWQNGVGATERVARTPADYPIVSITAWQRGDGVTCLAGTGLAKRPFCLPDIEEPLTEDSITTAAQTAHEAVVHPGDFRGDAAYRSQMAAVLTRRVLQQIADGEVAR